MKTVKIPAFKILRNAYEKFGVAAFNVFNVEQIYGVFSGAEAAGMPVIVQITPAACNYINHKFLK